jgi:hypothetical protein
LFRVDFLDELQQRCFVLLPQEIYPLFVCAFEVIDFFPNYFAFLLIERQLLFVEIR